MPGIFYQVHFYEIHGDILPFLSSAADLHCKIIIRRVALRGRINDQRLCFDKGGSQQANNKEDIVFHLVAIFIRLQIMPAGSYYEGGFIPKKGGKPVILIA